MTTTVTGMGELDFGRCYRALQARDARFDGQFFVTVTSTGIYCRPSCPAQTPLPRNVAFVLTAATAQHRGFRACRRCLPDAVPGSPRWNLGADVSSRAMRLVADGVVERDGVSGLAAKLGYSPRHLSRVLTDNLGAGPLALARAHRASAARILIQCTRMPMSEVAFAAGFSSVRQFNDTVRDVFGLTPTALRRLPAHTTGAVDSLSGGISLRLAYRPPYRWEWMRWLLSAHAVGFVESVESNAESWLFRRVLDLPHGPALALVAPRDGHVAVTLRHLDMRDLGTAVNRIRRMLDLDADAAAADVVLAGDPHLADLVGGSPGLRAPGTADAAETVLRTMVGQQISVKAARTHLTALVDALGEPVGWAGDAGKVFPRPAAIAEHGAQVLRGPRRRVENIVAVASALADGRLDPHAGLTTSELRAELCALPGVGPWTADIVAMRITGDPDVFLGTDLVVRRAISALGIEPAHSEVWRPWRSYASMHLWRHHLAQTGAPV